jgi:hypothetical protein
MPFLNVKAQKIPQHDMQLPQALRLGRGLAMNERSTGNHRKPRSVFKTITYKN